MDGENVKKKNIPEGNKASVGEEPSDSGLLGSGLSRVERERDLLMTIGSPFDLSIVMTGGMASLDSETLRSCSLFIDRRTEPKAAKGLLGDTEAEIGVACLLGPKGRRERRERKEGMALLGLAGVGVDGE